MRDEFIIFNIKDRGDFVILEFELKRELTPRDLRDVDPPDPVKGRFSSRGVILSGRGPIWFYGYLIHFYHPTRFIAVYDPRLNSGVVVESHTTEVKIGDLIQI